MGIIDDIQNSDNSKLYEGKVTKQTLDDIIKDTIFENNEKSITLFTGLGGANTFDTEFIIGSCFKDFNTLADHFRRLKEQNFKLKIENARLKTPWYRKIYYYIKDKFNVGY